MLSPPPQCHHMFLWTSWFPSWLWQQCSWLLRLGRPWGATTLSRWCEWWYAGRWNTRRGLKLKSSNYPHHGHHGNLFLQGKIPESFPARKNSHGTTGNRTRDLMISSKRPWPLDHEAGLYEKDKNYKKYIKHKPCIFANTLHCGKHYIPLSAMPLTVFFLNLNTINYWRYMTIF